MKAILKHNSDKALKVLKPERRRMYAYAGHDSTISNFLIAMGAWDTQIPVYGILVMIELHEDPITHQHGVKVTLQE